MTPTRKALEAKLPLSLQMIHTLAGKAQIAFCLNKYTSFEEAFARAIESALAAPAAPEAEGWRPIETAPQAGFMLVHEDDAMRALMRIDGVWHKPGYPALVNEWGDAIVGEDAMRLLLAGYRLEVRDGCCENPTEWQPLPPPPTKPGSTEGGS